METRRFGRTGHQSTVAIFGGFAFSECSQEAADEAMERLIIAHGVNHIDIAPTYGNAEERLGPWMKTERERFFLGCKTMERSRDGARAAVDESLARLQVESFDLYQIHAITRFEELDEATRTGGALEGILRAQEEGLTRYIGITGHGLDAPAIFLEALRRFDFDSVLFAINFMMYANPTYRADAERLLEECRRRDVGTMIIKSMAKGPWGQVPKTKNTWYEPFTDTERIQQGVNFVLSQPVTGLCTPGDLEVLPRVLEACEQFTPLSEAEQRALMETAAQYEPLFT